MCKEAFGGEPQRIRPQRAGAAHTSRKMQHDTQYLLSRRVQSCEGREFQCEIPPCDRTEIFSRPNPILIEVNYAPPRLDSSTLRRVRRIRDRHIDPGSPPTPPDAYR